MQPLISDSITRLPAQVAGQPLICASHGGLYSAMCALRAGVSAVFFNDAGRGRENSGIAGLDLLQRHGVPAAAVSHRSARIGDGIDCYRRGVVSSINESARAIGAREGMRTLEVWGIVAAARTITPSQSSADVPEFAEARFAVPGLGAMSVVAMDSVSLVTEEDGDAVVITGSHGGLLGGDPRSAIKTDVFAAIFNDADVGIDDAGISRLAALSERGIAAVTVSAWSARIGDARSTLEDGVISHVNAIATDRGALSGQTTRQFLDLLAEAWTRQRQSQRSSTQHGAHG